MARIDSDVVLGDRYRLIGPLSAGGMGSVWEGEDTVLHRRVAVKVMSDGLAADRRFVDRFRREARAAAGLSHPNVAAVFDFGEDHGSPFIVMELLDGETLADRLERGALDPDEAVGIAVGVAEALQAAHDSGIIHRDVKPGNVMLASSGDVKVMDFGIAAATWAAPLTATGHTLGTATYISPEQARGQTVDARSDVYSLGVVLFEMLTGRPPFQGDSPVAMAAAHAQEPPPSLGRSAPQLPAHVVAACERALAKDPDDRPPSAAAFAAMLRSPQADQTEVIPSDRTAELPASHPAVPAGAAILPAAAAWISHRRGVLLPLAIAAVLALLAVGLVSALDDDPPPRVNVPEVVGASQEQAEAALGAVGLKVEGIEFVEGEPGVAVDSDPPPGDSVRPGTSVTLYVGMAPEEEQGGEPANRGKGKGRGRVETAGTTDG